MCLLLAQSGHFAAKVDYGRLGRGDDRPRCWLLMSRYDQRAKTDERAADLPL
jgi:hypothetical protein